MSDWFSDWCDIFKEQLRRIMANVKIDFPKDLFTKEEEEILKKTLEDTTLGGVIDNRSPWQKLKDRLLGN